MKSQDQNEAIAKWMGWEPTTDVIPFMWAPGHVSDTIAKWKRGSDYLVETPNYCGDLNAMHEAEAKLRTAPGTYQPGGIGHYLRRLCEVCGRDSNSMVEENFIVCTFATSAQRAEALLKTLNLWTE